MTVQRAPGSTVLRQIENRMGIMNIEVETGWTPDQIRDLAAEEGFAYDSGTTRFYRAPDHVIRSQRRDHTQAVTTYPTLTTAGTGEADHGLVSSEPESEAPAVRPVVEVGVPTAPPTSTTVDIDALVAVGLAHPDEAIAAHAARIQGAAGRLAELLIEWESSAMAEVRHLEQLLADARKRAGITIPGGATALPAKKPAPKPRPSGPTQSELREWALANNVPVNPRGSVRREVVDAYLEAHGEVAS